VTHAILQHVKGRLLTRPLLCLCLQIIGITSTCLDADSSDARLRQTSAAALREELEWGIHLGLQACILPLPYRLDNANFAHVINQVSKLLLLVISCHHLAMTQHFRTHCDFEMVSLPLGF